MVDNVSNPGVGFNRLLTPTPPPVSTGAPPVPTPAMAPDQAQVAAARSPQILAMLPIFAHQLSSNNPVDVTMALSALESYGPAYKADVTAMVVQQLSPGIGTMQAQELISYLVRNNATEAAPKLLEMIQYGSGDGKIVASAAYGKLAGATPPNQTVAAGPAGTAPGAYVTPGVGVPPELQGLLERLKRSGNDSNDAAVEIARLPTPQLIALAKSGIASNLGSGIDTLLMTALCKRVPDAGTVDAVRETLKSHASSLSTDGLVRAELALIYHGDARDLPGILRTIVKGYGGFVTYETRAALIRGIMTRPEMLNNPVTTTALGAIMQDGGSWGAGMQAAEALAVIRSPAARDALGDAPMIRNSSFSTAKRVRVLQLLTQHPKPFNQYTIDAVRAATNDIDKEVAAAAKATLAKIT